MESGIDKVVNVVDGSVEKVVRCLDSGIDKFQRLAYYCMFLACWCIFLGFLAFCIWIYSCYYHERINPAVAGGIRNKEL